MNLDGYCTLVNVLKNSSDYQNVYKTLFYPLEIESYMEQHKIYEIIGELLVRVGVERPPDSKVIDFMIEKLTEIQENFNRKKIVNIDFHNCSEDAVKFLKKLSTKLHIPIIYENFPEPLNSNQHIIICDLKDDTSNGQFMRISTDNDNNNNNSNNRKSLDCNLKLKKAIDLKLCYNNLKYVIQNVRLAKPLKHTRGEWNCRVLVVGRIGSGRKTQASLLAKEFGLILIDLDRMAIEYEQQSFVSGTHVLGFWGFIQETLLKPQCLHNGYAIVSNVISRKYLELLMEKFIHRPNQIIFIHTNENKCRRRISKQKGIYFTYHDNIADVVSSTSSTSNIPKSSSTCEAYLDYQMNLYNLHKKDFFKYFKCQKDLRNKIYHVNGNGSVDDVKSNIWARFCCT